MNVMSPDYSAVLRRVQELAKRYSHMPGTSLVVSPATGMVDHIYLAYKFNGPNSERPGPTETFTTRVHHYKSLAVMDDEMIVRMVFGDVFKELILHEHDEWSRFDGKVINEPHPEAPDRLMFGRRDAFAPVPDFKGVSVVAAALDEAVPLQVDFQPYPDDLTFAQRYAAGDAMKAKLLSYGELVALETDEFRKGKWVLDDVD